MEKERRTEQGRNCPDRKFTRSDRNPCPKVRENNERRTRDLGERGFRVIRFWNDDALLRTDAVLEAILVALAEAPVDVGR